MTAFTAPPMNFLKLNGSGSGPGIGAENTGVATRSAERTMVVAKRMMEFERKKGEEREETYDK